ncbi:MAG TPA: thiamine phosphate synthase [Pyrinomonadaceae bacterium]|nr:thiamine phosphate synthase [Pyrinomonadaceae bacterium]
MQKIGNKLIYLITKGETNAENFAEKQGEILEIIKRAVEAEISLIQIREKQLSAKLLYELAKNAAQITKDSNTKLLINDRADVAFAADADGVHLTEKSLSAETIRANFPKDFIIGVSVHTLGKALEVKANGADFVTFSPIFHSPNKGEPVGLEKLREVCEKLEDFPVIALGGIDETNYMEVLEIADGFAAIRFLNNFINAKARRCKDAKL